MNTPSDKADQRRYGPMVGALSRKAAALKVKVGELEAELQRLKAAVSYKGGQVKIRCDCEKPEARCKACNHGDRCPVHILTCEGKSP